MDVSEVVRGNLGWEDIGICSFHEGVITWPKPGRQPAIYKWTFTTGSNQTIYIGECVDLRRRIYQYSKPGPTQPTNQRLNSRIKDILGNGGKVQLSILDMSKIVTDLELSDKFLRRCLENLAILGSTKDGMELLNA